MSKYKVTFNFKEVLDIDNAANEEEAEMFAFDCSDYVKDGYVPDTITVEDNSLKVFDIWIEYNHTLSGIRDYYYFRHKAKSYEEACRLSVKNFYNLFIQDQCEIEDIKIRQVEK